MKKVTFKDLVDSVRQYIKSEENASWKDFDNAKHIQDLFDVELQDDYKNVAVAFLNALIRDEGKNLVNYLETMDCLEYGYAFERRNYESI